MLLKKRLTRYHKQIIAEVFRERTLRDGTEQELLVDSKTFNNSIFPKEPTEKTYEAANEWADRVILLHFKFTKND